MKKVLRLFLNGSNVDSNTKVTNVKPQLTAYDRCDGLYNTEATFPP